MSRLKSRLSTVEFDIRGATKRERKRYINALKFGLKAWVDTAQTNIPLWTGASRASLEKIAEGANKALGDETAKLDININTAATATAIRRFGEPGVKRRQKQGRDQSTGGFTVTKKSITFFYSTKLPWLVNNESGIKDEFSKYTKTPIPYNFLEQSDKAAQAVILKRLKGRTIDLSGNLKIKTVISKG